MTAPSPLDVLREALDDVRDHGAFAMAENVRLARQVADLEGKLEDAKQILREQAYQGLRPHRECIVCGWPEAKHPGPGRYKGNVENTHEQGCSLDEVLNDRPAFRLRHRRAAARSPDPQEPQT